MAGGQQITSSQGTLLPDDGHGLAATVSQGSVGLSITLALAGIAIAISQGIANPNTDGTVPLTGSSTTVVQQTIEPSWGQALTGSSGASGLTAPSVNLRPTDIIGQAVTTSTGTATASGGGDISAHLSGQEITSSQGDTTSGTQEPTGIGSTTAAGTAAPVLELALSGIESVCSQGSTAPEQQAVDTLITSGEGSVVGAVSVLLVGSSATGAQGTLTVTGDSDIALSGQASTFAQGTISIEESYPITGSEISSVQYPVGAPGGASLSGASFSAIAGNVFTDNDRSFALTGASLTSHGGATFASSLAFPVGQELVSGLQGIGPRQAALTGIESQSQQGAVSLPVDASVDNSGGWYRPYLFRKPKLKKNKLEEERIEEEKTIVNVLPKPVVNVAKEVKVTKDPDESLKKRRKKALEKLLLD